MSHNRAGAGAEPWGVGGRPFRRHAPSPFARILLVLLLGVMAGSCALETEERGTPEAPPRNVILVVVDGMGFNYIDATRLYLGEGVRYQVQGPPGAVEALPAEGEPVLSFEDFPVQLAMSTHTALGEYDPERAWSSFEAVKGIEYEPTTVTGSAASATSLSSGVKTIDPAVGLDAEGEPVLHLAEYAHSLGKAAGVVANVALNHATPAGFLAHNGSRNNYHEITREMLFESDATVIMGTGHPFYDDDGERLDSPRYFWIPEDAWEEVSSEESEWTLVESRDDFRSLASGPTPERVLGVARAFNATQFNRDPTPLAESFRDGPSGRVDPLETPFEVPLNEGVPSLAEMTSAALNTLENASEEGFFLMVEGGAADWGGHWNLLGRTIEDMLAVHEAVAAALEWVESRSNWEETLVVVTSDHETGHLSGPGSGPGWEPLVGRGAGELPEFEWYHTYHTNQLVPFFARGAGAEGFEGYADNRSDPVRGPFLDNTEVARWIFELWGRS